MCNIGHIPSVDLCSECAILLKDENEVVRILALDLISIITLLYQDEPVTISGFGEEETIRLLDSTFVKACDLVSDISILVRQKAFETLGKFSDVDSRFLMQTLSKQVMSNLKRPTRHKKSVQKDSNKLDISETEHHEEKKTKIDVPKSDFSADVDVEEFELLNSGAAGAFVHGLEDEFKDVRLAAIDAISKLCKKNSDFANKSVDFLMGLNSEQLSIILSSIHDANHKVRIKIYILLSLSYLSSLTDLRVVISSFHNILKKYHKDKDSIFLALRKIGENNSILIDEEFACNIFGVNKLYSNKEPSIYDPIYLGNTFLVINAFASKKETIPNAVFVLIFRYIPYLVEKYPKCFPKATVYCFPKEFDLLKEKVSMLKELELPDKDFTDSNKGSLEQLWEEFYCAVSTGSEETACIFSRNKLNFAEKAFALKNNFKRLLDSSKSISPIFSFHLLYLDLVCNFYSLNEYPRNLESANKKINTFQKSELSVYQLSCGYSGYSFNTLARIYDVFLHMTANILLSFSEILTKSDYFCSICAFIDFGQNLIKTFGAEFANALTINKWLPDLKKTFTPAKVNVENCVKKVYSEFLEQNTDDAVKYNHDFPCAVSIEATIHSILQASENSLDNTYKKNNPTEAKVDPPIKPLKSQIEKPNTGILVSLPSGESCVFPVPKSGLSLIKNNSNTSHFELNSKVAVYLPFSGGESCTVSFSIVRFIPNSFVFDFASMFPKLRFHLDSYSFYYPQNSTEINPDKRKAEDYETRIRNQKYIEISESPSLVKLLPLKAQKSSY
ncbi:hypothetical protein BB560_006980 [Smittium megazygosporum]|uniref:Condensin complex subunit 1 C-terminal domain-containing protein n=1 Tax=Smittium megazygosporum TaxID=133381 RepID=A0A2T9XZN4_9FUNG|nr:hypothetical protein BB560_006980 [Smittium megazygosporum]